MYSKGAREGVRQYEAESHLRKYQRWRYQHLRKVDKITGKINHEVSGKNGQIWSPTDPEEEKPLVENSPLVDVGDKYPSTTI